MLIISLTSQAFTQWNRLNILQHFLLLWKGSTPFFSASTQRWEVLLKHVPIVVKRVIDTQWSAHYKAVKALQHYFLDVVSTLNELCDQNKSIDTRGQAHGILDAIQQFSFVSFLQFWMEVLRESYDTQKYLQRRGLSLENCSHKINAFIAFLVNDPDALVKQILKLLSRFAKSKKLQLKSDVFEGRKRCLVNMQKT